MTPPLDPIDFTLWRDNVMLGRIRIAFPTRSPDLIAGMLEVEPSFNDIDELMQTSHRQLPGSPVFESKLADAHKGPGPVALRQLTPAEAAGIPRGRVIELRDHAGTPHATDMIVIDRLPPMLMDRGELFDICTARGIPISPWHCSAHLAGWMNRRP